MSGRLSGGRFAFLDHPGPIAFAHRGGAAESPENTWPAFQHAVDLGYRYIETDVHATADGVVAVIHDPALDGVSDRVGLVRELPWREVARARVGGEATVPRLDEILAAWPTVRFNIDAKHPSAVGPLVDTLRRSRALDRVCVTAFSDRRIRAVKQALGPTLCVAMGPVATAAFRLSSLTPPLWQRQRPWAGFGAAQVPLTWRGTPVVDERFVTAAHRAGLAVHVWTIDDEATMDALLDLGVDGIMTDQPSRLKGVLQRRGLWSAGAT